ncbi:hypothetical protein SAMN02745165_03204 [Malonomonas rubra DSM 5091]|uniref:Uncharacterized protein n=1 Tax=Malonomonas rubra DSM 5091 TaxID=1122189 RepID=A0A1M6M7N4_MALRU|nr:hypothetical protein [Malonomonas rubra]SHJ79469.1 hypothetical protein SAMN02745165_03204 [Malonomonas rubra DSM 5091]
MQNLKKPIKIIIGLLTAWPIIYFIFFMFAMFSVSDESKGNILHNNFDTFFNLHLITILMGWALIGFYIWFLFKSDRVPQEKKSLWGIVLFMGNVLAFPFFFFIYVWPEKASNKAINRTENTSVQN